MKHQAPDRKSQSSHLGCNRAATGQLQGRRFPHVLPALQRLMGSRLLRRILWHSYVAALVILQLVILHLAQELVDLYVSAVELWAELAAKHLSITL